MKPAIQDLVNPYGVCFGCGPANQDGLQLKSYWADDNEHVQCIITPERRFNGWPGLVYGGFLAMVIDCHSNWTVIANHYKKELRDFSSKPKIDCVTGHLSIKYLKPTPMDVPLLFSGHVEGEVSRKTRVIVEVYAGDVLTVKAENLFVRVDTHNLADQAHHPNNPHTVG